jgi:arsenite methyltransferase
VDVLHNVQQRYSEASREAEPGLCCPVDFDPEYLEVIPADVLERDYGCGDPVSHLRPGEVVLDLGSGGGKVCFIAAQLVGRAGSVIGVDVNDDMLALARRAQATVAARLGYNNVTFMKARIEDLALDLEFLDTQLAGHPVAGYDDLERFEERIQRLRRDSPLIADGSVDVVISNCVLNLVASSRKPSMFAEIARVLRPGGRAVISDIVSNIDVPAELQEDPKLWSGCYSGALREDRFLQALHDVGMYGLTLLKREATWKTIGGVAFHSITVAAYKPLPPAQESGEKRCVVVYRGPFASVTTDDGYTLRRGVDTAIPAAAAARLAQPPYEDQLFAASAQVPQQARVRQPGTGLDRAATTTTSDCAGAVGCAC